MTTSVLLPDSTVVHLNSGILPPLSHLFAGDVRQVELNGEAYFDVTQHPGNDSSFPPLHSQVEVYGTSFNVGKHTVMKLPFPPRLSKAAWVYL